MTRILIASVFKHRSVLSLLSHLHKHRHHTEESPAVHRSPLTARAQGIQRMLSALSSLGLLLHAPLSLPRTAAVRVHRSGAPPMLFEWPWAVGRDGGSKDESGKFLRHSSLQPGCAPLGVVVAGLVEDELEEVAACIEGVWQGAAGEPLLHVPIAVLAESDLRLRLRDILADLPARDSVLPDRPASARVPLILLSGFNTVQTSATVRAVRALELRGEDATQRPMFAVAVPKALSKTLRVLIDELEGDHLANAAPTLLDGPPDGDV